MCPCTCMFYQLLRSSLCSDTKSYRWQPWEWIQGVEVDYRRRTICFFLWKKNISCFLSACLHIQTAVSFLFQGQLLKRRPQLGLSVPSHTSWYERVLWRSPPIHTVAHPAHLDKQAWPFIISTITPEVLASGFCLHYAQETSSHLSSSNFLSLQWVEGGGFN